MILGTKARDSVNLKTNLINSKEIEENKEVIHFDCLKWALKMKQKFYTGQLDPWTLFR